MNGWLGLALAVAAPATLHAIDHGSRDIPRVALTFDACSGSGPGAIDGAILAALEAARAKATFFVGGRWAEQDPVRAERLLSNPDFEVESHAERHPHLPSLSDSDLRDELLRGIASLQARDRQPTLLRAPYGESDPRVVEIARSVGLTVIGFDLASGDPDPHADKIHLVRWVLGHVKPGSIVVFHVNGRGWHTAEALPEILAGLRAKGLEPVTVGQLLGLRATQTAILCDGEQPQARN